MPASAVTGDGADAPTNIRPGAAVDALVRPHGNPREVAMRDLEDFLTTTLAVRLRPKKTPQRRPDAMV
jgi:hypothetical protein